MIVPYLFIGLLVILFLANTFIFLLNKWLKIIGYKLAHTTCYILSFFILLISGILIGMYIVSAMLSIQF